jgi:peptidoglycan/LPS O-acetylase OafA/YrhL
LKSSTGKYYAGLDHIRAIAAFMVFTWHFIHVCKGEYAPPPMYPLSLLTEGHTGVSLFMTLSGYLFAKLLAGKNINFPSFLWNRLLRLAPLLIVVVFIVGFEKHLSGEDPLAYTLSMVQGLVLPRLPNGGWSITVELHFYLLLPLLLFLSRKSIYFLIFFVLGMIVFRTLLYLQEGDIQVISYLTIVGHVDQFVFGIIAYEYRHLLKARHLVALIVFLCFAGFFWFFDSLGGFNRSPAQPFPSSIWIYLGTVEGIAYALLIAWYDTSFEHSSSALSRFIALIGTYSYSIYLLHPFFVYGLAATINNHVIELSNIYLALLFSPIALLVMIPLGWASYRIIESPFLRFRTNYILGTDSSP